MSFYFSSSSSFISLCLVAIFPQLCLGFVLSVPSLSPSSFAPPVSLVLFPAFFFFSLSLKSLFLLFLPGFGTLSAKNESDSLCRLWFFRHDASGKKQWGSRACVNHSHSPHLSFDIQAAVTHTHTRTHAHSHSWQLICICWVF